jgi:hypothetical protein
MLKTPQYIGTKHICQVLLSETRLIFNGSMLRFIYCEKYIEGSRTLGRVTHGMAPSAMRIIGVRRMD